MSRPLIAFEKQRRKKNSFMLNYKEQFTHVEFMSLCFTHGEERVHTLSDICNIGWHLLNDNSPFTHQERIELYCEFTGIIKHFLGSARGYDARNYKKLNRLMDRVNAAEKVVSKRTKTLTSKWDF